MLCTGKLAKKNRTEDGDGDGGGGAVHRKVGEEKQDRRW